MHGDCDLSDQDEADLASNIETFYDLMKIYYASTPLSGSIDIDSTEFIVEAAYNYLAVLNGMEYEDISMGSFTISEPISGDQMDLNDIGDAFWRIKDSIMSEVNNSPYTTPELGHFDLSVTYGDLGAEFTITYGIIEAQAKTINLSNGTRTFTEASNHGWATAQFQPSPWGTLPYVQEQVDINTTTKTTSNVNTSVLGAAGSLRSYGLGNFWANASFSAFGYYVNITPVWVGGWNQSSVSSPTSSYSTLNIPGYEITSPALVRTYNTGIWNTWIFSDINANTNSTTDPDIVYKDYLTTPMMNFYLGLIPSYIINNVPSGAKLYDFHIGEYHPFYPVLTPNQVHAQLGTNPYNTYALKEDYQYRITYGKYIRSKPGGGFGISNL